MLSVVLMKCNTRCARSVFVVIFGSFVFDGIVFFEYLVGDIVEVRLGLFLGVFCFCNKVVCIFELIIGLGLDLIISGFGGGGDDGKRVDVGN